MNDARITKNIVMKGAELVDRNRGESRWAKGTKTLLQETGLDRFWEDKAGVLWLDKEAWKMEVYEAVELLMLKKRREGLETTISGSRYNQLRFWGRIPHKEARTRAEINRLAHRVVPRYLEEWSSHRGSCRLKMAFRTGTFPTLEKIAAMRYPGGLGKICLMCDKNCKESIEHIILECEAYESSRKTLEDATEEFILRFRPEWKSAFLGGSKEIRCLLWLGDLSLAKQNAFMDRKVKNFLRKLWRTRRPLTKLIDRATGREDWKYLNGKAS